MVARKVKRKYFPCSIYVYDYIVGAKPNRVILGPSPNHASVRII